MPAVAEEPNVERARGSTQERGNLLCMHEVSPWRKQWGRLGLKQGNWGREVQNTSEETLPDPESGGSIWGLAGCGEAEYKDSKAPLTN